MPTGKREGRQEETAHRTHTHKLNASNTYTNSTHRTQTQTYTNSKHRTHTQTQRIEHIHKRNASNTRTNSSTSHFKLSVKVSVIQSNSTHECLLRQNMNPKNKVRYTATEAACGWAGAVMKKAYPSIWAGAVTKVSPVTPKKLTQTDRQTNRSTDRHSGI